jgi:hypothetical protein
MRAHLSVPKISPDTRQLAKIFSPSSAIPTAGVAMSSPIGFREFSEDDYRKFIRTLSDEELTKAGKRFRILCGDVVIPTPSAFDRQLKICREEYRRRRPKPKLPVERINLA